MKFPVTTPGREAVAGPRATRPAGEVFDLEQVPDSDYGTMVRLGLLVLAVGFGGFLLWAIFAPLDEGVPAQGVVSVESKRKHLDHLTGGIIDRIVVREGEHVREGQELIVLNEVQAKAALDAYQSQWRIAAANEARLNAERLGLKTISFPKELTDAATAEPSVASMLRAQTELFRSRRTALEGELTIIRESVRGLELQLKSLERLQEGRDKQVQLFEEQLVSFRTLNKEGFVSRNALLDMERQLAEVQSKQSESLSNMASVNARLAEFRMRDAQRNFEYRREVESQLADVQRDLPTAAERVRAQRDTYSRLVVRTPVSGTVVDLAFYTVGGIIKAGDRILDIVPDGDELIVEAQVSPQYIDRVYPGLPADVHFDAYMGRVDRPMVTGKVKVVSADALTDQRTNNTYYAIRVAVPPSELRKLGKLQIQPGMQGTVMVKTGERSLLVYLARPLFRRFTTALGEH